MKQIVVIAGPSGTGKNAIIDELIRRYPKCTRLVTATTRAPRPGEQEDVDYYFFSEEKFFGELKAGNILEHREIKSLGTHYGVYKPDLEARLTRGEVVLAHLDIIGVKYLHEHYDATSIFIMPENEGMLRSRIKRSRPEMTEKELDDRMLIAKHEMADDAPQCDYRVVNAEGKLMQTVDDIVEILKKEGYTLQ